MPLAAEADGAAFQPAEKITTAEQLREELRRQRELYQPYLRDLAPPLEKTRIRVPLASFDWRLETEADRRDFAGVLQGRGVWQRVKIPHYGGPMGRAAAYYRTEFEVTPEMLAYGALFVRFQGADYKAHAFLNGTYLGSHEGIFAPFEFDVTPHARPGKNVLVVKLLNDFIMLGNDERTGFMRNPTVARDYCELQGDKLYAAVGPGWDEPEVGWHACPPGMGIYQDVDDRSPPPPPRTRCLRPPAAGRGPGRGVDRGVQLWQSAPSPSYCNFRCSDRTSAPPSLATEPLLRRRSALPG